MKQNDFNITLNVNRKCPDGVELIPLADLLKAVQCCLGDPNCRVCPIHKREDCMSFMVDQARRWQGRLKVKNMEVTKDDSACSLRRISDCL